MNNIENAAFPLKFIIADYYNKAHAAAIISLMKEYALDPMGGGEALSSYAEQNMVAKLQHIQGAFSVLALSGDLPVGLVNCIPGFSTFYCKPLVNIHDLIVTKAFRGQNIAYEMLSIVEKKAVEKGCCKLTLEVLEGNLAARSAYQKFGFSGYVLNPEMGNALFWDKNLI